MNIVDYLKELLTYNEGAKPATIAETLLDVYPNFPYKSGSVKVMLQIIGRDKGHTIAGKRIIDPTLFPMLSENMASVEDVDLSNFIDEEAGIELEEQAMKLEKSDEPYTYSEGIYTLGKDLTLSGELVSKLFVDYPTKGLSLSRTALMNKYNLKDYGTDGPTVLRTIQHKLGLYKDSNIVPPHMYDELAAAELEKYIEDQIDSVINNPEFIEKKYNSRIMMQYRKVIGEKSLAQSRITDHIAELTETFKQIDQEIYLTKNEAALNGNVVVTLADMHSGAQVKGVQRTHDFDRHVIKARLDNIAKDLNEGGYENVYLAIMGDMFQGSPYNHIGAGNTISEQYAEQFKLAYELLVGFIQKVNNLTGIYAIGGNHDRATSDNREDQKSSMLDILMFTISSVLNIEIEFHHDTLSFEVDNIVYILQHGHLNYHKKPAADIILDHGDAKKFNMILRGHLHSLQVTNNDDRRNYRRVVVPSIYTGEDYSSTGGWSNNAGFTKFSKSKLNTEDKMLAPKMVVEPLG